MELASKLRKSFSLVKRTSLILRGLSAMVLPKAVIASRAFRSFLVTCLDTLETCPPSWVIFVSAATIATRPPARSFRNSFSDSRRSFWTLSTLALPKPAAACCAFRSCTAAFLDALEACDPSRANISFATMNESRDLARSFRNSLSNR
jgi:hypothetical protein